MIYSDLYIQKNNKLPTVIGFLFILFTTVIFSRFFLGNLTGPSKASLKVAKRVEIVNLSPTQVSVFWQTDQSESGWVVYGEVENKENKIVSDEKDLNNLGSQKGKYIVHLATLKELVPGKKYFFKIVTDNNKVIVQPDGNSFSFITPQSTLNGLQNISPAFGRVLRSNSVDPLINSYIILSIKGGYSLLTQIKSEGDGSWLIPLNQIYSKDSQNILTMSDKDKIVIEVVTSEGELLTITTIKSKISPLPQTTVFIKDKNFSFVEEDNVLSASIDLGTVINNQIEILYPKESSLIPGNVPLIKGVALPLTRIEITINSSKAYSAVTTSDSKGNWSYLLPENLELGPHTIVIKTKDKTGKEVAITRKFTIIAQQGNEGRVLGTATGEPTITFTITPIPTTIAYSTSIPTMPSNITTTPPVSGSNFSGIIFSSLSLIIIGGGILLAF
ncbi:MAG: fibronectin type III domain-containing protein [Patescibacteria group bacterium]